eukprot:c17002_g1_i2.p1 GENE.c17002_g1_i2~~c17002_g1_i2.p1  ORF type:complete len:377 (-),score=97.35 c17002_g1_i2:43-1173(-)
MKSQTDNEFLTQLIESKTQFPPINKTCDPKTQFGIQYISSFSLFPSSHLPKTSVPWSEFPVGVLQVLRNDIFTNTQTFSSSSSPTILLLPKLMVNREHHQQQKMASDSASAHFLAHNFSSRSSLNTPRQKSQPQSNGTTSTKRTNVSSRGGTENTASNTSDEEERRVLTRKRRRTIGKEIEDSIGFCVAKKSRLNDLSTKHRKSKDSDSESDDSEIFIGEKYQATVPNLISSNKKELDSEEQRLIGECIWVPQYQSLSDKSCEEYLKISKMALSLSSTENKKIGSTTLLRVPNDEILLSHLQKHNYNISAALSQIYSLKSFESVWSSQEIFEFRRALLMFGKNFSKIASFIPSKSCQEIVHFYYFQKNKSENLVRE